MVATTNPLEESRHPRTPLLLYGVILISAALRFHFVVILLFIVSAPFGGYAVFRDFSLLALAIGGSAVLAGVVLCLIDCFVLLPGKRMNRLTYYRPVANPQLTVVLTAYNDEQSIGDSVRDFLGHRLVKRVIVVDNNSRDRTSAIAREAGAEVVLETDPGYGKCVHRALSEGLRQTDTELTLLCEGDMTFRAFDIDKFMPTFRTRTS